MKRAVWILVVAAFLTTQAEASIISSYPRGGGFKQLHSTHDPWYYIDHENWLFKAPDKWQHMMGSYAATELLGQVIDNKLACGGIILGLGILKEVEDGYREGWSVRDVLMDLTGVGASLLDSDRYKLWCDWKDETVLLRFSLTLR